MDPRVGTRMAATGTRTLATTSAMLCEVTINTAAASAVLTIYNNTAGSGDIVAVIDCSSRTPLRYFMNCPAGITAVMSGGNADVTIMVG